MKAMPFTNQEIRVRIPHDQEPDMFLVGPDGKYPSDTYDSARHTTLENVVHDVGQRLGTMALGVAMREENREGSIVYRTKPIPGLAPPDGYSWQRQAHKDA